MVLVGIKPTCKENDEGELNLYGIKVSFTVHLCAFRRNVNNSSVSILLSSARFPLE